MGVGSLRKLFAIDKRMIPTKVACLLAYGILGSYLPYFNIFFISVGLSKSNAGIITGLTFLPPILAGPLWGYLGDVTGRRRSILVLLCLGSGVLMFSTPWLASNIYPKSQFNMTQYESCFETLNQNTFAIFNRDFQHRRLEPKDGGAMEGPATTPNLAPKTNKTISFRRIMTNATSTPSYSKIPITASAAGITTGITPTRINATGLSTTAGHNITTTIVSTNKGIII